MPAYHPAHYGDACAEFYDQLYPTVPTGLIAALLGLAEGGAVLELGLATGRVAIPLSQAGVQMHGIESSWRMLQAFRQRVASDRVHAIAGDFCAMPYRPHFQLVYCLVSTLGLLPDQASQWRCLKEVARVLRPGGVFLCECFDPADARPSCHVHLIHTPGGWREYHVSHWPTPPATLDALAHAAGLVLDQRWGDWAGRPFRPEHAHCVSIYPKSKKD